MTGANRSYMDLQGRYAAPRGLGYKLAGEYNTSTTGPTASAPPLAATSPWEVSEGDTTGLTVTSNVLRVYGSIVRYLATGRSR